MRYSPDKIFILMVTIYLFGILRHFQYCTGHITTRSWKGRGNQYIQLVKVLYCKLLTNGKQLPAIPLEAVQGTKPRSQRWKVRVLPLTHRCPLKVTTARTKVKSRSHHDIAHLHPQSISQLSINFLYLTVLRYSPDKLFPSPARSSTCPSGHNG